MATKAKNPILEGHRTVTPHFLFDDAAKAIDWYKKALGAEEKARALGPDGKIIHAELQIGDSRIMLNDAMGTAKKPGDSAVDIWLYVDDCDALYRRAVSAGAREGEGPMGKLQDQFWGDRSGTFEDPYGYRWSIATRKEDLSPRELEQRQKEFMAQFAPQPTR